MTAMLSGRSRPYQILKGIPGTGRLFMEVAAAVIEQRIPIRTLEITAVEAVSALRPFLEARAAPIR